MIFTVRQLVDKSWEHRAKLFLVFIDFKKAYVSVLHEVLWLALSKLGVPEQMIKLIRSFHCGMQAQMRLCDDKLEPIYVNDSLRHSCSMAPILFDLYSCLVIEW